MTNEEKIDAVAALCKTLYGTQSAYVILAFPIQPGPGMGYYRTNTSSENVQAILTQTLKYILK